MIILNTDAITELMRKEPDPKAADWIQTHETSEFAITVIALAEILRGIARLPKGKRRQQLDEKFQAFIKQGFRGRILPFDEASARLYGDLCAQREKTGLGVDPVDMMIASIAKHNGAIIATRNVNDFYGCGVEAINPWVIDVM